MKNGNRICGLESNGKSINSLTAPANNTRYQVKLHNTATETEQFKMLDSMKLAALSNNLKPFDNTLDTVNDFPDDFDRHIPALDLKEPQEKLDCLVGHFTGPVKTWFRYQPKFTQANYADLWKALQETFVVTDQAKHMAHSSLFNDASAVSVSGWLPPRNPRKRQRISYVRERPG